MQEAVPAVLVLVVVEVVNGLVVGLGGGLSVWTVVRAVGGCGCVGRGLSRGCCGEK